MYHRLSKDQRREGDPETFALSVARAVYPNALRDAKVKATETQTRLIDDFSRGFHDWYTLNINNRHHWFVSTRKLADPRWEAPQGAKLSFEIAPTEPGNTLAAELKTDSWRSYTGRKAETWTALVPLAKAGRQRVELSASAFTNSAGETLEDWYSITELIFQPGAKSQTPSAHDFKPWSGEVPRLFELHWIGGELSRRQKPFLPKDHSVSRRSSDAVRKTGAQIASISPRHASESAKLITSLTVLPGKRPRVVIDGELFDMDAIRDPQTLEIDVLQDWHVVRGPVATRQKLVSINVGDMWPGQEYRVPVRMVVPFDRKAKGFHLTGGSTPSRLQKDSNLNPLERELIRGGVGLVTTVVQEPGTYGQRELAQAAEKRFAETLNPRYKIQYWAWPATLMRAITTAFAETDHFQAGKVAASGGSKNGASPSMAILHDERMTAVHATVSPIWDSPLRLCDRAAWDELESQPGRRGGFSGGHFGPNFNRRVLAEGHSWKDLQNFTREISDDVFISRNLTSLRKRGVEMLFHPGTHDMVAFDMAWGGTHHPDIPVYLGANTGHGKKGHPRLERDQANKAAFLLQHFFPEKVSGRLLSPPKVEDAIVDGNVLEVIVRFPEDSDEENGRIWWMFDRAPDGSPNYLSEMIPDDNCVDMHRDSKRGVWVFEIELDPNTQHIDFFSNHRKTIRYGDTNYPTYISSPYTRVELRN